jgi:hypothetical protein
LLIGNGKQMDLASNMPIKHSLLSESQVLLTCTALYHHIRCSFETLILRISISSHEFLKPFKHVV